MTHAEFGALMRKLVQAVMDRDVEFVRSLPFVGKVYWPTRHRPHIPLDVRRAVFERDGYCCVLCSDSERLSLDHVKPYSKGGEDTVENLRLLCVDCNRRRGNRE